MKIFHFWLTAEFQVFLKRDVKEAHTQPDTVCFINILYWHYIVHPMFYIYMAWEKIRPLQYGFWLRNHTRFVSSILTRLFWTHANRDSFQHFHHPRSPVDSPSVCAWPNGWANNRDTGDLRRHCTHYYVIVMYENLQRHTVSNVWWKD